MTYDPAPPYGSDVERDPDYRKCGVCGTWYCPANADTTTPAVYVCMTCRSKAK